MKRPSKPQKKKDLNDAVCGNLRKESIPGLINL